MSVKIFYFILETHIPLFSANNLCVIETFHCMQNGMSLVANAAVNMEIELSLKSSCYSYWPPVDMFV